MTDQKSLVPFVPRDEPLSTPIDARIVDAKDPQEAVLFTQVRGELMRQDTEMRKELALVAAQKREFWFRVGFCGTTLATGVGLVLGGFSLPGFFIAGGAMALLAPDYVKHFVNTVFKNNDSDE